MVNILTQINVPANSTVPVFMIPPGYFSATIYSTAASTVFLGISTAVTASNGYAVHTVPTSFNGAMTSKANQVYAANSTGAAATFNLFMITDQ
jgi:hypothetical protein